MFRGAAAVLLECRFFSWFFPIRIEGPGAASRFIHAWRAHGPSASGGFSRRGPWCILGAPASFDRRATAGKCGFERERGGVVEKAREAISTFTPPLRGSQRGKGEVRRRVGGGSFFCGMSPHRFSLRANRSASSSGFPLGKPDPQGGSEIRCALSVAFFNSPSSPVASGPHSSIWFDPPIPP